MDLNIKTVSTLQTGEPYKTYRKTILGKVRILAFNVFTQKPEEVLLAGNPLDTNSMYSVYSEMEDLFFRRNNMRHLKEGTIIAHSVVSDAEEVGVEQSSDEEIRKAVNSKFAVLQNLLRDTESETFINRVLTIAREEEKSDKIIGFIETRLSEIQMKKAGN
jgi:hypothetical protein